MSLELHAREQLLVAETLVAHHVDLPDARALAFVDVHVDVDQVSGLILHPHIDAHVVAAAREVLVDEVLAHVLEHVAVEDLAAGETDVAQRFRQVLGLDDPCCP